MERKGPATMPQALAAVPARRMVPLPQQPQQHQHQQQSSRSGTVPPGPPIPLSPGQVVAIVREARNKALQGNDVRGTAEADADGLKPGITLDLIAKNIPTLPDEVIDILQNGVERYVLMSPFVVQERTRANDSWPSLALSHNFLASLPARFSQCTSLRYLAARNNAFEAFPLPVSIHRPPGINVD